MPAYQKIIWVALGVTVIAILAVAYFLFLAPQAREKADLKTELTPRELPQQSESALIKPAEDKDFSP